MKNACHELSTLILCIFLLILTAHPGWAQQQVRFDSYAEIEVTHVDEEGKTVIERQPVTSAPPATMIIFSNVLTNTTPEAVADLVVTNPVPANMEYVSGSASGQETTITFSIDGGKTYDSPRYLIITESDGTVRPAQPREYTNIRWQLNGSLEPGQKRSVEFRAMVK